MIEVTKHALWTQMGASIDTLEKGITLCPESLLAENKRIFYMIYHTLVFLDYYLTMPFEDFKANLPYTLTDRSAIPEYALDDVLPDRFYSKSELLDYLHTSREKCRQFIANLTEEKINTLRFTEDYPDGMDYSVVEMLLYNMRHVQHHAAQLNLLLRTNIDQSPGWVFRAVENAG